MRKILLFLCVLLVISSCQSAEEAQQELQQQAQQQAQQQVDKAVEAAQEETNKAKDSFLGGVRDTIGSWVKGVQNWWGSIWGNPPVTLPDPMPGSGPNPPTGNLIYKVGSSNARGRTCSRLKCTAIVTFKSGQDIQVSGTENGDVIDGNDIWLQVPYQGSTVFVHSSLASPTGSQAPPQEPEPIADIPASVPPIGVPFLTQVGTAGVNGSGSNNCGPASVAMVIRFFGGSITVEDAAVAIRGSNTAKNKGTNFKGSSTIQLLTKPEYGLTTTDVSTFDDLRKQIGDKHPVIILINNTVYRYINPAPYVNDSNGWFVDNHILVVTGYDADYVYVNDPLRYQAGSISQPENYKIPVGKFKDAASTTPQSSQAEWFAMSVSRK